MLVLVGGLVGGLFGREGGGCRGVGGRGGLWGVLGASGGGRKGQGSDVVMEFVYSAPTASSTSTKPREATKTKVYANFCCFTSTRAASESDSCHSPIRGDEFWVSKSPPGEIPNFGAGHEIKSQPRFVHAVLTCRFASQPPCRSRVPGRRAHRTPSFPTQNLLPSMDLKEQN